MEKLKASGNSKNYSMVINLSAIAAKGAPPMVSQTLTFTFHFSFIFFFFFGVKKSKKKNKKKFHTKKIKINK